MASQPPDRFPVPPSDSRRISSLRREGLGHLDNAWGGIGPVRSQPQPIQFNTVHDRTPISNEPDHAFTESRQREPVGVLPSFEEQFGSIVRRPIVREPNSSSSSSENGFQWSNSETDGIRHSRSVAAGSRAEHYSSTTMDSDEETRWPSVQDGALAGARDRDDDSDNSSSHPLGAAGHTSHAISTSSHGAPTSAPPGPSSIGEAAGPSSQRGRRKNQKAELHHKTKVENLLARKVELCGQPAPKPCNKCQRGGKQCKIDPEQSKRCSNCIMAKDKCEFN